MKINLNGLMQQTYARGFYRTTLVWFLIGALSACGASASTPLAETRPINANGTAATPSAVSAIPSPQIISTPFILPAELKMPACAPAVEKPLELPTPFAPNFPFPPGMKIFRSAVLRDDPAHVQQQIGAIVPLNLNDSAAYLNDALLRAGYKLGRGDSEKGEVDALFNGNGWVGSFRINEIDNCFEATTWTIRVLKL